MPKTQAEKEQQAGELFLYCIVNTTPDELEILSNLLSQAVKTRNKSAPKEK
jgi:hypothetical protein